MTGSTGWLAAVIHDAFFQGHLEDFRIRQVDFRNIRRRRWWWILEDTLEHPDTAFKRMRILAIGVHRQDGSTRQHPTAIHLRVNGNPTKMRTMYIGNSIMSSQAFVDHRVIRMDKVHDAAVAFQELLEKSDRLLPHGFFQRAVGDMSHTVQAIHAEPLLHKILREAPGARVCQHAFDLRPQDTGLLELPLLSELQQLLIRNTGPEENRETTGQLQLTDRPRLPGLLRGDFLRQVEKLRRGQDGRQHFHHGIFEVRKPWTVPGKQGHELVHLS